MKALDEFLGIPWADHGRTWDGADCWGLLVLIYRDVLGVELPHYADAYVTAADRRVCAQAIAGNRGDWVEVPAGQERRYDGVLMFEGREARHIGLVVDPGYLIHMVPGHESVVENYRTGPLSRRLAGFFRHEALA